jgi:hypothetical protein
MHMGAAHIGGLGARQTQDHRFRQSLFHRPRYFQLGEDVWGLFREMARRLVQVPQAQKSGGRGLDAICEGRRHHFMTADRLSKSGEILAC